MQLDNLLYLNKQKSSLDYMFWKLGVVGCYKGAAEAWAGQANKEWWKGVLIKRNISNGCYEPQWVSLDTLRREYG